MNFNEAFKKMKKGYKIKRPDWIGFWCIEDDTIKMYCKDGRILDLFTENDDKMMTAENLASDDFIVVNKADCPLLNKTDSLEDAQIRAYNLMKKIEEDCIKYRLNITIKDGQIGFVDQRLNKIVMLWKAKYKSN